MSDAMGLYGGCSPCAIDIGNVVDQLYVARTEEFRILQVRDEQANLSYYHLTRVAK